MTPEEIQAMAKGLAEGQAVWYVLSAGIGGALAGVGAYLAEKGKNRATKEDIGEITRAVKEIEAGFNEKLADLQAHHQLRMVAAERRMQAHQEAYTHWVEATSALRVDEAEWERIYQNARSWHRRHNLFLGRETRNAFIVALQGCVRWRILAGTNPPDIERAEKIYLEEVNALLPVLFSEVDLPPIAAGELISKRATPV